MEVFAAVGAWALGSICANIPADSNGIANILCPRGPNIQTELAPKLSTGAAIYTPGTPEFDVATERWSLYKAPNFTVVVEVATESDVQKTIQYANKKNISFLAKNGGHGAITSLGKVNHGIEIWLNKLNSITVNGDTATFGGGVLSKAVTDTLWAAGKQTVSGACECTSLLGPALGGGHGFLQGKHGLISDQFVSARMVNDNGDVLTVSPTSHSDLWWGLQGAGHNFGIVTQMTSKIYDIEDGGTWSYVSYIYTADKVEGLYTAINKLSTNQSVGLINYSFFFRMAAIDPTNPVIAFFILREGVTAVEDQYTAPFVALGPVVTDGGSGKYTDLPEWTGNANDSPPCQKGNVNMRFPVDIQQYNPTAQRQAFDAFAKTTAEIPQFNGSLFLFEGYSLQGVKAVPADSTAFPHRGDNLLVSPLVVYAPNPSLDKEAIAMGENLRQIIYKGSGQTELHTYVNYAFGDEQQKNWYGYESWRQTKLKALKAKYDPKHKFSFYAPIA